MEHEIFWLHLTIFPSVIKFCWQARANKFFFNPQFTDTLDLGMWFGWTKGGWVFKLVVFSQGIGRNLTPPKCKGWQANLFHLCTKQVPYV